MYDGTCTISYPRRFQEKQCFVLHIFSQCVELKFGKTKSIIFFIIGRTISDICLNWCIMVIQINKSNLKNIQGAQVSFTGTNMRSYFFAFHYELSNRPCACISLIVRAEPCFCRHLNQFYLNYLF